MPDKDSPFAQISEQLIMQEVYLLSNSICLFPPL